MDRIANAGLRYTQFHSTALCSPSRAAIITGHNHHSVGFGVITEFSTGYPGYDSIIGPESATVGTILKQNGYATSWFGKNHNTPSYQISSAGPFNQWPSGMGFDYFYGFIGGETDQWTPFLFRNQTQVFPWREHPGYNLTTDMADDAINYLRGVNNAAPDKPFFLYYVPGGSHAPHQPTPEWIKKISDMHLFDQGWEKLRETIFANQKRLGTRSVPTRRSCSSVRRMFLQPTRPTPTMKSAGSFRKSKPRASSTIRSSSLSAATTVPAPKDQSLVPQSIWPRSRASTFQSRTS